MHVLVSGANGYLGSVLVPALLACEKVTKVTALVRQPQRFAGSALLAGCQLADMQDVVDGNDVMAGVDIVCHLAAVRDSTKPGDLATWLELTSQLIAQASLAGVRGIINFSSQAVYGLAEPLWREDTPVAPVTLYGASKHGAELLMKNVARVAPPIRTLSLRIAKLVGPAPVFRVVPSEPPHLLAYHALAGKPVTLPHAGLQKFDLMDVRDAASVIVRLVASQPDQWPAVMNVGSGQSVTLAEVAGRVGNIAASRHGTPLHYRVGPAGEHQLRHFGMAIDRLEQQLGWKAHYSLDQTIADVLAALAAKT